MAAESNAMHTQLTVLDRDPAVTELAGRPVPLPLPWRAPDRQIRSWVPQLQAPYTNGTTLPADYPNHPDTRGERAPGATQAVAVAYADIGRTYHRHRSRTP